MIDRILLRRREPGSIFEHIDAHVLPGGNGLAEGGYELPDEAEFTRGDELPFAPGALEGILGRGAPTPEDEAAVGRIHEALVALAAKQSSGNRARLRALFREGHVRARIDGLRDRLSAESPPNAVRLYPELREIFLSSGHRDEVKYAMALVSGFGRPEDADLFRLVGRHEEFTLYAAVALATVTDDPVGEWLGLLEHVSGWGRTELSELILRDPQPEVVRERLLRAGHGEGNALTLARGCWLDQLLARAEVDDELLASARAVVDELLWDIGPPSVLSDYDQAGPVVEALLGHIGARERGLAEFLTAFELRRFLAEAGDEECEACGFDEARRGRVLALCAAYCDGEGWRGLAEAAARGDSEYEQYLGGEVARRLGAENP